MQRRILSILVGIAFVGVLAATGAWGDNPHFLRASASGPDADGDVDCRFKIAGLGDNVSITVECSADATAVYACQNNGGNFPSDPRKTQVSGPVSATGEFTSGKNGQVSGSLTLNPPPSTLDCPGGQREVLVSVSYTNVQIEGGGDTAIVAGTFSRTFFNI
jgi:hypothetical protein